ncbi:uncharacterized protein MONOS_13060 [Monocercomonoides exilis]|uniref:uncharacterized protein n=1 Tax=Monocercomonoides exilis TaxID=2049356 RepID=UPI00355A348F|nr:hypothetical protein MONOS_13060 [Monocercomonoides exilis]|eukprot:MONOS_13060.1-p1 / transcript=MONOS_13060.1 / gene=MONOS_13060 / organism=Monocercomonoides_exilis_PA203 / gene_product=unspecified product / transcript_product=unspecified product / location=Mono_scaffold00773:1494-9290(-) / protein_length=2598 / sequence_SO=supercontig / SO=protein_coding / is_pseudo=false
MCSSDAQKALPSLVSSLPESSSLLSQNMLEIDQSNFGSFCVSSHPFCSSPSLISVRIGHSSFSNISSLTKPEPSKPDESILFHLSTKMRCCSFEAVCDAIDGGIIPSINELRHSLNLFNSSFRACSRTPRPNEAQHGTQENPINVSSRIGLPDGNHEFEWCEWIDLPKYAGNGGAISCSISSANVSIHNCLFQNCSSKSDGGAIYFHPIAVANITETDFIGCQAGGNGGAIHQYQNTYVNQMVHFLKCNFRNCSINGNFGTSICGGFDKFPSSGEIELGYCEFDGNYGNNAYGSITFGNTPSLKPRTISVNNCKFQKNSLSSTSSLYGGAAIAFIPSKSWISGFKFIFLCLFDGNIAANGRGNDIHFYGGDVIESPFSNCFSTTKEKRIWNNNTADNQTVNDWITYYYEKFVKSDGTDKNKCGVTEADACETLEYAVGQADANSEWEVILLPSSFSPSSCVDVGTKQIEMNGNDKATCIVQTNMLPSGASVSLFSISLGSLSASSFSIVHNSFQSPSPSLFILTQQAAALTISDLTITGSSSAIIFSSSLFMVLFGSMSISSSDISSVALASAPLFHFGTLSDVVNITSTGMSDVTRSDGGAALVADSDGYLSLSVSSCEFVRCGCSKSADGGSHLLRIGNGNSVEIDGCTFAECFAGSEGGKGGALCANVEMGEGGGRKMIVSESKFEGCECSEESGRGGAIYVQLKGSAEAFRLTQPMFGGNKAKWGKNVFIAAGNIDEEDVRNWLDWSLTEDELGCLDDIEGVETEAAYGDVVLPLVVYLWENFTGPVHVGGSRAADFSACGFAEAPCSSISRGLALRFSLAESGVIQLHAPFVLSEEVAVPEGEWRMGCGEELKVGIDVSVSSDISQEGVIASGSSFSIEKIVMNVKSLHSEIEYLMMCVGGVLRVSSCEVDLREATRGVGLVAGRGGEVEIEDVKMSGNGLECGVSVISFKGGNGGGWLKMTRCNISGININGVAESGSGVEWMNGGLLEMSECNLSEIVSERGNGGGVRVVIEKTGTKAWNDESEPMVKLSGCVFNGCCVEGEGRMGGGVCVECVEYGNAADADADADIVIEGCQFKRCEAPTSGAEEGYGGGMMIALEEGGDRFAVRDPVFGDGGSKPNKAKYGSNMFVQSAELRGSITNTTLPFMDGMRGEEGIEEQFMGYDGSDRANAIPLVYFFEEIGAEAYVGSGGADTVVCGFERHPCRSLHHTVTRLEGGEGKRIIVSGESEVGSEVDVSGVDVRCASGSLPCVVRCLKEVGGNTGTVIVNTKRCVIQGIVFAIPCSFGNGDKRLIATQCVEGVLEVEESSFGMDEGESGSIEFVMITVNEGTLLCTRLSMQSVSTSCPIICLENSGTINMSSCNLSDVECEGCSTLGVEVVLSEDPEMGMSSTKMAHDKSNNNTTANIEVNECVFSRVEQKNGNTPGLLRGTTISGLTLRANNTTLEGCGSSSSERGGAVLFDLGDGGFVTWEDCQASECFAKSSGRGGVIFLDCSSSTQAPLPFRFSNIDFSANTALRGRDVYVRCTNIDAQINETQFDLDFGTSFNRTFAIWGCTMQTFEDEEDLLLRVAPFMDYVVFASSTAPEASDSIHCGSSSAPCESVNVGLRHVISSTYSILFIFGNSLIAGPASARDVAIRSADRVETATVHLDQPANGAEEEGIVVCTLRVEIDLITFAFGAHFSSPHPSLLHVKSGSLVLSRTMFSAQDMLNTPSASNEQTLQLSMVRVAQGSLSILQSRIASMRIALPFLLIREANAVNVSHLDVSEMFFTGNVMELHNASDVHMESVRLENVVANGSCVIVDGCMIVSVEKLACSNTQANGSVFKIHSTNPGSNSNGNWNVSLIDLCISNITSSATDASLFCADQLSGKVHLSNCSLSQSTSQSSNPTVASFKSCSEITVDLCSFMGKQQEPLASIEMDSGAICRWNESLVELSGSIAIIRDTTMGNASQGALGVRGGVVNIEEGKFFDNNPRIEGYPSVRRNVVCEGNGSLSLTSLKGGDGWKDNSSLWILGSGCQLSGLSDNRPSELFIPSLESVKTEQKGEFTTLHFKGLLLLPCNLSFSVIVAVGEEETVDPYSFERDGFISEEAVVADISSAMIEQSSDESEVSVAIQFGRIDSPSSTDRIILKNKSESGSKGDERIVEGGKEGKSSWVLIVIVLLVVVLLIILAIAIVLAVRWRNAKNEAKDLREIVNDTVKKDSKAFEMVTMEMSPEEQWRRAEREAEKKNEERIKKRVYENSLGHSESSEHLLSESGSTEYILGKDSDKIPQWALEKVDEKEEETRKRTPSPSISSTSTTDTSDTDTTFVRGEDLCPTTSSMSNLVDAMACSSPHEKLIVDLRDSMFMLLHGRNEKKEIEIGSLQQREMTASQILFWVANVALHSFEDEEDELPSLTNLSPHIVLFSEHMVICIVMHSDLLSDDDSDSSSISSSTIVTSASDDDRDSLLSLAFEDEDEFQKECLRWKAPELQINMKMGATKESVAFSIGMMLWECLTLNIPFGEFEAEVAGQKIVNGERPNMEMSNSSSLVEVIQSCVSEDVSKRLKLTDLKREFFQRFPKDALIFTISDAIDLDEETEIPNIKQETAVSFEAH